MPRLSRRDALAAGLAGLTGCVGRGLANPPKTVPDPSVSSPAFRRTAAHDAAYAESPPDEYIEEKWRTSIAGHAAGAPALADGILYVADSDGYAHAIDARDGSGVWTTSLEREDIGVGETSAPALGHGRLYVTSEWGLHGLDPATGGEQFFAPEITQGPPVVGTQYVYIGDGHRVTAVDPDTGDWQWRFALGDDRLESVGLHDTPAVADGTVYVGVDDSLDEGERTFYALDPEDNTAGWTADTGRRHHYTPTVAGETVYVAAADDRDRRGHVYALDRATGAVHFHVTLDGHPAEALAVADGTLYVGATDGVRALDAATGATRWHFRGGGRLDVNEGDAFDAESPVVAGDSVLIHGDRDGERYLYVLNRESGAARWRRPGGYGSPVPADGALYVLGGTGSILGPEGAVAALGAYWSGGESR